MFSARPPSTYARRKARTRSQDSNRQIPPSSPLQELSPSKHDVTLSEMSRRMKKRSRQVVAGTQEVVEKGVEDRLAKKLRRPSELDLRSMADMSPVPTVPSTPVHHSGLTLPLDTQQIYDSLFETPFHPTDETLIKSYVEPDQLSPLPVGRRMLSRTSSRNLKENFGTARHGLASPFASRPTSRASSPRRSSKTPGKRSLHSKSRTLSSSYFKQQYKSASVTQSADSLYQKDSTVDSIFSPTTHGPAPLLTTHSRTGSIPAMPSTLLDHIPAKDWLVPAKALSRSPPSLEDMDMDDIAAEHPSFYLGEPLQISTPPRRRRTTITLKNYRPSAVERHNSASISMDLTDPVTAAEEDRTTMSAEGAAGPAHPRRGRRTVVHMSGDSIFSSALDFSAYMTEFSPTQKINSAPSVTPEAPPGLTHPAADLLEPEFPSSSRNPHTLDPAFSPASGAAAAAAAVSTSISVFAPAASAPRSPAAIGCVSLSVPPSPDVSRPSLNRRARSLQTPSVADREELHEKFTMMGLGDVDEEAPREVDDSGVGLEKTIPDRPPSSGRTAAQTHRRKRGDTIRASDFARPAFVLESASTAGSSAGAKKAVAAPGTRRTRSGTVTLAKPPPAARTRKRVGGRATIPVKIDDKPLTPQGSDEEDDELLLRRGVYWKDD